MGLYVIYFDSFDVEHIPKEIIKFIDYPSSSASLSKNVIVNIFRIEAYDSIMCGCFCIGFTNLMFKRKTLTEYTNLFSPNNFKKMTIEFWIISQAIHMYKMESYCLKCRKHTENIDPKISGSRNGKTMIL